MRGSGRLLHSGCVDTREQPGWIYDSSEPYDLILSAEPLHLCVGDNSHYECMQSLREVLRFATIEGISRKCKRPSKSQRRKDCDASAASSFHFSVSVDNI